MNKLQIDISACQIIDKKDINLCAYKECNKKIKITDYPCKCKNYYCRLHKLSENHECTYDYRENWLKSKKIDDLKCVSNKMQKIS